jgi:adenylylsulfate kinase
MSDNKVRKSPNTVWHHATVTRARRQQQNGHKSVVLWFTGLSGAGKSTVAHAVEEALHQRGCHTFVFDGDNVRHGLCSDLSFSEEARKENIRRVGEMAKLFIEAGIISLTAFISPYRADRQKVRELVAPGDFIEVYCRCSLEVCEKRDVKGLYMRARRGEIREFTGISSPYEEPVNAELVIDTGEAPLQECVQQVIAYLVRNGYLG